VGNTMNNKEQGRIVAKPGGSSMAMAETIQLVAENIYSNPDRRFVVVSAPGKRFSGDEKVTDLLLECNRLVQQGMPYEQAFEKVSERFEDIGKGLNCHSSVVGWLDEIYKGIPSKGKDWIASRGEWGMANIFAKFMNGSFVDAKNLIKLKENGDIDPLTYGIIQEQLRENSLYVIPGFYGESDGEIKIFARGGSDISGAIIARGVHASVYENWTDVNGVKAVDPRIVKEAKTIREMTYDEMRELSYRGGGVLQMDAVLPVMEVGIPINLRNTFNPKDPGTMIRGSREIPQGQTVIGIAGKDGYRNYIFHKRGMHDIRGIGDEILQRFRQSGISFDHTTTALDAMSVICQEAQIQENEEAVLEAIQKTIQPDEITINGDIGMICVVGNGIPARSVSVHAKLYTALEDQGIATLGESYIGGNNIVIAVHSADLQRTIHSLYNTFVQ